MTAEPGRALQAGDHVIIGEPRRDSVHWIIQGFTHRNGGSVAILKSGQSGRLRLATVASLTLHTAKEQP